MKKTILSRRSIIIVAVILSIFIYFLGVFSGLYANKIIKKKVDSDIGFLKNYVDVSSLDFKNILLQQLLIDHVEDKCLFSGLYLENLRNQLEPYWQKLPSRLEAYDKSGKITDDYVALKREYIRLSLRIWIISRENYENCNNNFIPLLYFYDNECETCVKQGEIFDDLKDVMRKDNRSVFVFPIDIKFKDDNVKLLKEYYNITSVPSVVIKNTLLSGRIIPVEKFLEII